MEKLLVLASNKGVQFDPGKTELIHCYTRRTIVEDSITIGNIVTEPKTVVRWLGIWFDSRLSFKAHIERKIDAATAAGAAS